ncbi:transglutaminase family protein [Arenibacter sp. TNZ]|jgi:transglutaminase-like putative cysteine protease|uniref:transglutaminase family protein n=1 Tax=Arenibacter TaxID=178469 RepID=UPI000CD42B42|nr:MULTISPECIES: transglutaminase family protein [Arenibacter]MCM4173884.1 transglutaminase family protein [Arenibacter sp. TNZ]
MEVEIIHETEYEYQSEVYLEPHYFRFKPRETSYAELKKFKLQVSPKVAGISQQTDAENNTIHFSWFEGMHTKLSIKSTSILTIIPYNPFNFLLYPSSINQMPFAYDEALKKLLYPFIEKISIGASLKEYGDALLLGVNGNTLAFLRELTMHIHEDFDLEIREEGEPHQPDQTFELKKGSCRDFAWMQIQLLRHLGIAARFVSGYFYVEVDNPKYELHGWTEVFLPGAGWIGYDPSNGIRTSNMYFPVSSSATYLNTMPVSGSVRGNATSILTTSLEIKVRP